MHTPFEVELEEAVPSAGLQLVSEQALLYNWATE